MTVPHTKEGTIEGAVTLSRALPVCPHCEQDMAPTVLNRNGRGTCPHCSQEFGWTFDTTAGVPYYRLCQRPHPLA